MLRRIIVMLALVLAGVLGAGSTAQAITGGSSVSAGQWGFVVRVNVGGDRGCSGALVAPQWVVTADVCFATDGEELGTGVPARPTSVNVGGIDVPVVLVHPHTSRRLVLAKLALRVPDVTPVALSTVAPAAGEAVRATGYGRTATVWTPDQLTAAAVAVGPVSADSFGWTGQQVSACQGDTGGPVLRTGGTQPELLGLTVASGQGGCLDASGSRYGATAVRVDDVAEWITNTTQDIRTTFQSYDSSSEGLGGFDLGNAADQVVPFDYDHSGKLDHLVLYRPGTGLVSIVKRDPADGTFKAVFSSTSGIGSFDLKSAADRIVAFDYDHSGKQDHLVLYRPGSRIAYVLKHTTGNTFPVVHHSTSGIGTYDLGDAADQMLAYDYDKSGKLDHLLVYRPGAGLVAIIEHDTDGTFRKVFASTTGIGGADLKSSADRIVAFDYDHSRKLDHLVIYRPGSKVAIVLKHGAGNVFTAVYSATTGIGGYSLADTRDKLLAYDYENSGRLDHLVLYRPGAGIVHILRHGTGNTFAPVVASVTGIGGYDMTGSADRIVAFDRDHTGGSNYLLPHRPGSKLASVVSRQPPFVRIGAVRRPVTAITDSTVERFSYPGAEAIFESMNVRLISGDGHILLADCDTTPVNQVGVISVHTTEQIGPDSAGLICFKVTGPRGRLDLQVPGVFEIRGDGQQSGYGHQLTAVVRTGSSAPTTVECDPSGSVQVGIGADPDSAPAILLQLRVPA